MIQICRQFKTQLSYLSVQDAKEILDKVKVLVKDYLGISNPNQMQQQQATDMILAMSIFCLRGQRPSFGLQLQFRAFKPYFEDNALYQLDTFEEIEKV